MWSVDNGDYGTLQGGLWHRRILVSDPLTGDYRTYELLSLMRTHFRFQAEFLNLRSSP